MNFGIFMGFKDSLGEFMEKLEILIKKKIIQKGLEKGLNI